MVFHKKNKEAFMEFATLNSCNGRLGALINRTASLLGLRESSDMANTALGTMRFAEANIALLRRLALLLEQRDDHFLSCCRAQTIECLNENTGIQSSLLDLALKTKAMVFLAVNRSQREKVIPSVQTIEQLLFVSVDLKIFLSQLLCAIDQT